MLLVYAGCSTLLLLLHCASSWSRGRQGARVNLVRASAASASPRHITRRSASHDQVFARTKVATMLHCRIRFQCTLRSVLNIQVYAVCFGRDGQRDGCVGPMHTPARSSPGGAPIEQAHHHTTIINPALAFLTVHQAPPLRARGAFTHTRHARQPHTPTRPSERASQRGGRANAYNKGQP